ncbi:MAG: PQQ-binding-like beta-propeller repeat protein [Flavobacteriaceae bacterium]|nr:PQQ-binding-like beta-propeller repeat protein [Flavobacteriaceae bacterium]MDG2475933.1 PQQ-binding-like beta-propeller repeat protein [Flavobacteriaceae bacterium]
MKNKNLLLLLSFLSLISATIVFYPIIYYSYNSSSVFFKKKDDNIVLEALKISLLYEPLNKIRNNVENFSIFRDNNNRIDDFNPYLQIEDSILRSQQKEFIDQPFFDEKSIKYPKEKNITNKSAKTYTSSGNNSLRYYESTSKLDEPRLHKVINMATIDGSNFLLGGKKNASVQATPIYKDGNLYFVTSEYSLVSFNLKSNKVNFKIKFPVIPARRGMIIEENPDSSKLYFNVGEYIVCIDAKSGDFISSFGDSGFVKIGIGLTNPLIVGDNIITSTVNPKSAIISLNKNTGKINWQTNLRDKTFKDGAAPWSGFSVKDSMIFVSTGNPRPPLYGASRLGENKFSNSVVALNIHNGDVIWHFQETSHGLWDLDISSTPLVYNKKVYVPTKKGNLLILDSKNGNFIGKYNMQRAPTSNVPGEVTSEYQVNIIDPPPFLKSFDKNDLRVDINLNDYNYGFHAPPSLQKPTIMYGIHGGSSWPGASINKKTNQIIIASNKTPWRLRLYLQSDYLPTLKNFKNQSKLYENKCLSCHGPLRNGDYTTISQLEQNYIPSLVGIKYTSAGKTMQSKEKFLSFHNFDITINDLKALKQYFNNLDQELLKDDLIYMRSLWSMFYDKEKLPITKPPWSEIITYDLNDNKISWRSPIGDYPELKMNHPTGQMIHGGLVTSSDSIVYASGTPDNYVRSFNLKDGSVRWEYEMLNAGSGPPLLYNEDGKSYLVVVSTGGIYFSYKEGLKQIYIFEL